MASEKLYQDTLNVNVSSGLLYVEPFLSTALPFL